MQRVAKPNWRLKKTLDREVDFRPIEREDVRYVWAAYKKGALTDMGEPFNNKNLSAEEFKQAFEDILVSTYHGAWTLFAKSPRGYMPVGVVLGFWSHPDPKYAPFMIIGEMIWFSWASKRNKIEAAVNFFNSIRHEIQMVEYAKFKDKPFFEMIARHGIMRRIGTSYSVYKEEPVAVFETRRP